jgi:DNA-binding protein YbaB
MTDAAITGAYRSASAAAEVQRVLAGVRGTGAADGVTAVVTGAGELVDLRIAPEAMRLGQARLGAAIVAACGFASDDVRQRGYTALALALGDEATAAVERYDGPAPARAMGWDTAAAAGAARPATGTAAAVEAAQDDDVFSFDASIFRSDR